MYSCIIKSKIQFYNTYSIVSKTNLLLFCSKSESKGFDVTGKYNVLFMNQIFLDVDVLLCIRCSIFIQYSSVYVSIIWLQTVKKHYCTVALIKCTAGYNFVSASLNGIPELCFIFYFSISVCKRPCRFRD